ncbi:MAG: iron-containing alcohol dehydrogenase [Thermoanaerobaculia bacterium]|nr:iron-containing alcohol dehydrogenase [Thermoanaerobaculia bacterium]
MSHDHDFGPGSWSADLGGSHVVFGAGVLNRLGELALDLPGVQAPPQRALLVTDPGLRAAGHARRAREALEASGLAVAIFDEVEENPTTAHVERGTEAAHRHGTDLLVGLGGGSAMDCCKGINFLLTQGGAMEDYWGVGKARRPMLPSIGVPTTGGTGSEAQRFALVSRASDHRKMACGDRKARFRTVVLDPDLLQTVPRHVATVTGLDAISHAVESHASRARSPLSQMYSREAFRRLDRAFATYLADPTDTDARADMLLGAHLGGAAIEASMLGAAHSLANPLTARYDVTHGVAVGLMLPHVVRFNGSAASADYADLLGGEPTDAAERLADRLQQLATLAEVPPDLASCGVDRAELPALGLRAAEQWTAQFNPREVDAAELTALYESAFESTILTPA